MAPRYLLFALLALLTGIRLACAGAIELSPDEAYYTLWSERLDICYFSKGPGIAAAIRLGTSLFGQNEFGVRFLSPWLGLGTSMLVFALGSRMFGEATGIWTAIAVNCLPIFNVGSLLLTIDPLSIFFWSLALYTFWRAVERGREFTIWWPVTGAIIGLGFLAKWTNAMQLLSIVLLLVSKRRLRIQFQRAGFWSLLAAFLPALLPPILWNARHDWVTLVHLGERGGLNKPFSFNVGEFLQFVGAHFGVYSPLLFLAVGIAVFADWRYNWLQLKQRFLLLFGLPLFVMYGWLSLKQAGEANWTAPGTISLGLLAAAFWVERAQASRVARWFCASALLTGVILTIFILRTEWLWAFTQPVRSALGSAVPKLAPLAEPHPWEFDPSTRLHGWQSIAARVEQVRAAIESEKGRSVFLIANNYGLAASISFYLKNRRVEGPGHPPVYTPETQAAENQFNFWPRYDALQDPKADSSDAPDEIGVSPMAGRSALYITTLEKEEEPASTVESGFKGEKRIVEDLRLVRNGSTVRVLRIWYCENYRGAEL